MAVKKRILENSSYEHLPNLTQNGLLENPAPEMLTHLSFCSGYGGIDIGLGKIFKNLRTIAYCEKDAIRSANLISKMEQGWLDAAPVWTNLVDFPIDSFRGLVDVITGGIPCQPFSVAGKQEANKSLKFLFFAYMDIIKQLQPKICMIENVDGLRNIKFQQKDETETAQTDVELENGENKSYELSLNHSKEIPEEELTDFTLLKDATQLTSEYLIARRKTPYILLSMLRDLEAIGYRVHFRLETATRVGLPQERKRLFVIGVRQDLSMEEVENYFMDNNMLLLEKSPYSRAKHQYAWENARLMQKKPTDMYGVETRKTKK